VAGSSEETVAGWWEQAGEMPVATAAGWWVLEEGSSGPEVEWWEPEEEWSAPGAAW
jgi:hypothetical protein